MDRSIYLERACNCSVLNWSGASSLRRTWIAFLRSRSSSISRYFCLRSRNLSSMVWALSLSCNEGSKSSTFSHSPCNTPCRNCMTGGDSRRNPDSFSRAVADVLYRKIQHCLAKSMLCGRRHRDPYLYPRSCSDCTIRRTSSCFLTCLLPCSESWTHSVWPFVRESDAGFVSVLMPRVLCRFRCCGWEETLREAATSVPLTSELSEAIVPIQHLIPFVEGKAVE